MTYFLIDCKLDKVIATADYYGELTNIRHANVTMILDLEQATQLGYILPEEEE